MSTLRSEEPLVLIIDEDSEELVALYSLLDQDGYLVATRTRPFDALKYVFEHRPEMVLVGRHLPRIQCRLFIEKLREISPGTPVVLFRSGEGTCPPEADALVEGTAADRNARRRLREAIRRLARPSPLAPAV